jgi:hypothetical protein
MGRARRAGDMRPRDTHRDRASSNAFAPAAHGGAAARAFPRGTARHRLAAVTPADRARTGTAILPALQF